MAKTQWGNVYYKDIFAGRLQEQADGRVSFTYDASYLDAAHPPIAQTLPLRSAPFLPLRGLLPFFDNLVAEGWLRRAQAQALGADPNHAFSLLLGFGYDLAGAVSVIDPEPSVHYPPDPADETTRLAVLNRASLSGVQRKLLLVAEGKTFRPANMNELSTHIGKLSSGNLNELLALEYLSTLAVKQLLPDDPIVDMTMMMLAGVHEEALVIPRFDRTPTGKRLHHFEEFNQLLGKYAGDDKYRGDYGEMGQFILNTEGCIATESTCLFRRILAYFLIGNTDAHFKNFAMFHTRDGLRLTPMYDVVASSVYPEYPYIALNVCGIPNLRINRLSTKHLLKMGSRFGVAPEMVAAIINALGQQLHQAITAIEKASVGTIVLKKQLSEMMEKRWRGSFLLTGQRLSKRQSKGVKNSD